MVKHFEREEESMNKLSKILFLVVFLGLAACTDVLINNSVGEKAKSEMRQQEENATPILTNPRAQVQSPGSAQSGDNN
jgi:hypothetical protein